MSDLKGVISEFSWAMKESGKQSLANPFDQNKDPREVMRELLKQSKAITHQEAMRKMKEAAEGRKRGK